MFWMPTSADVERFPCRNSSNDVDQTARRIPFTDAEEPSAVLSRRVAHEPAWAAAHYLVLEMLSPTRCAGCERAGQLLCDRCLSEFKLIDPVHACLRCGAPHGDMLCTECERDALHAEKHELMQVDGLNRCLAMATFAQPLSRIIRMYKDGGERRLAPLLADLLVQTATHAQEMVPVRYGGFLDDAEAIVFVPATATAYRRRGFDHMEAIAREVSNLAEIELVDALAKYGTSDQRELGRAERLRAARQSYRCICDVANKNVVLIDDVITTGATMRAAASVLKAAGAAHVDGLALARVW